jgi:HPt (histidine-containing phosphotransfer) domain-containing protein
MDDFLRKPVDLELLQRALADGHPAAEAGGFSVEPSAQVEDLDPEIWGRLATLDGGHGELRRELVTLFSRTARESLGRIHAAFEAGDLEALGKAAHGLKGSAANLGGARLSVACAAVEERARAGEAVPRSVLRSVEVALERLEGVFADVVPLEADRTETG